jgi:hypothetical protein
MSAYTCAQTGSKIIVVSVFNPGSDYQSTLRLTSRLAILIFFKRPSSKFPRPNI